MNEFSEYEYVVNPHNLKSVKRKKLLVRSLIIAVGLAFVIVMCAINLPMWAFIPAIPFACIFIYVNRRLSAELGYKIESGVLSFNKVYESHKNAANHKEIMHTTVKDAILIAPVGSEYDAEYKKYAPDVHYYALSSEHPADEYFMLFKDQSGACCAFHFEATQQALKIFKFYNSSNTVVKPVSR